MARSGGTSNFERTETSMKKTFSSLSQEQLPSLQAAEAYLSAMGGCATISPVGRSTI
jgi:hypothetical protein